MRLQLVNSLNKKNKERYEAKIAENPYHVEEMEARRKEQKKINSQKYYKIKKEAENTARKVKETILAQGKLDIERLTNSGKSSIEKAEIQIKKQIQQHITNLALKRVTSQLQDFMTPSVQSKLIDSNISQLGGQI